MSRRATPSADASGRRAWLVRAAALLVAPRVLAAAPERKWYDAAEAMKHLAESWGDQPYGAVLVLGDSLVGEGPSRVVKNRDASAHAEREAIRDAQRRLGRASIDGSVLYSTSRPCALCEAAAAEAGVARMYYGASLADAGTPRGSGVRPYRIGFVSPARRGPRNDAFVQGLRELGYVDGRNVVLELRFADGQPERLPALVAELVERQVDVLVVGATVGARAAKQATSTIPIVFAGSSDPVAGGVVDNLARPGGNITGFSLAVGDGFAGKWLDLLKDAVPATTRCAVLWSSSNAAATRFVDELQAAGQKLAVRLIVQHASNAAELDRALSSIRGSDANGMIVTPSPFAASSRDALVRFAASSRLPTMYFDEDFVDAGGLMSYGPSIAEAYRLAAAHVDKIVKGAKPGDLPVEQPTRYTLAINLATARTLGLRIPQSVLVRADRVV